MLSEKPLTNRLQIIVRPNEKQAFNNVEAFKRFDPANPYRYIEVRGTLQEVIPDPTGAFYVVLGKRYGNADQQPPAVEVRSRVRVSRPFAANARANSDAESSFTTPRKRL